MNTTESCWNSPNVEYYEIDGEQWRRRTIFYLRASGYSKAKYDAEKMRKKKFSLTKNEFDSLVAQPCVHCGYHNSERVGIDRIDNYGDYTVENCQPSCTTCNMMRRNVSVDEFYAKVGKVALRNCATNL